MGGAGIGAAFLELEMLGIKIDPKYKEKALEPVRGQTEARKRKRLLNAKDEEQTLEDYQDENYAYIAGYTSGGVPYGVAWESQKKGARFDLFRELRDTICVEEIVKFVTRSCMHYPQY